MLKIIDGTEEEPYIVEDDLNTSYVKDHPVESRSLVTLDLFKHIIC